MNPGPEMDKAVLEITGWKHSKSACEQIEPSSWSNGTDTIRHYDPKPSTDLPTAMRVVWPWLKVRFYRKELLTASSGGAWFLGNGVAFPIGQDEAHALCNAVLEFKGSNP